MDPILEPIIKSFLGQMDSAMKISELLADHSNSEEITVDHIVIGLIYRLMTPMNDDEITSALSNAEQMLENMDNSDDEDYDDIDECYENIKLGRNIQHPICNCSICRRRNALMHRVPATQFRLIEGADALKLYHFNTSTARHYFCNTCGIYPFHRPRIEPDAYTINVNCLADVDDNSI